MSYFYTILNVLECHHSAADLLVGSCSLTGREKVLQYLSHSFTQRTVEIFEDKVGIRFANSPL